MSSAKHFTEVLIGGKVYTLSGFEGEEYLQKVSSYLNHKITECTNSEGYRKQSADTRNVLLALNIADDYFKAKKQGDSHLQSKSQKTTWKSSITNKFPACSISTGPFTSIPP